MALHAHAQDVASRLHVLLQCCLRCVSSLASTHGVGGCQSAMFQQACSRSAPSDVCAPSLPHLPPRAARRQHFFERRGMSSAMQTRAGAHLQELRLKVRRVSRPRRVDSRGALSQKTLPSNQTCLIAHVSAKNQEYSAPDNSKHFGTI